MSDRGSDRGSDVVFACRRLQRLGNRFVVQQSVRRPDFTGPYRLRDRPVVIDGLADALEIGFGFASAGSVGELPVTRSLGDPRATVQLGVDELLADLVFDGVPGRCLDEGLDHLSDDRIDSIERLELILSRSEFPLALDPFGDVSSQPDDGASTLDSLIERHDTPFESSVSSVVSASYSTDRTSSVLIA